jgi:hypothetical protein
MVGTGRGLTRKNKTGDGTCWTCRVCLRELTCSGRKGLAAGWDAVICEQAPDSFHIYSLLYVKTPAAGNCVDMRLHYSQVKWILF